MNNIEKDVFEDNKNIVIFNYSKRGVKGLYEHLKNKD